MNVRLEDPWLVAVWPGMGGVALIAGAHLARQLAAHRLTQIPAGAYFEPQSIRVSQGLARAEALPESNLYACKTEPGRRDLLLFLGEAQPQAHGYRFCEDLLRVAEEYGARRVVTFAAMGTACHPTDPARVFAAANRSSLIQEARALGVEPLRDGEISGLNGLLLAAADHRDLPGLCLLGEFPYFAGSLPNPKASCAVLQVFGALTNLHLDLETLEERSREVEESLVEILEHLDDSSEATTDDGLELEGLLPGFVAEPVPEEPTAAEPRLEPEQVAEIEHLFEEARGDRSRALDLKAELDRHGLFKAYEDRFLDLFRRASD